MWARAQQIKFLIEIFNVHESIVILTIGSGEGQAHTTYIKYFIMLFSIFLFINGVFPIFDEHYLVVIKPSLHLKKLWKILDLFLIRNFAEKLAECVYPFCVLKLFHFKIYRITLCLCSCLCRYDSFYIRNK